MIFRALAVLTPLFIACGPKQGAEPPVGKQSASEAPEAQSEARAESAESADPTGTFKGALGVVGKRKLYVEDIGGLLLYVDERLVAQKMIADWATAVGFEIIDPTSVHQTLQQAAAGKNPKTGQACGPPLDHEWATNRWLPELGAAGHFKAAVYCRPDCSIQISLQLDGQGTEFFAASFDPTQPWQEELHRSLRRLRDNGGHGKHGHLNNPVDVAGAKRSADVSDWYYDEVDQMEAPQALLDKSLSCDLGHGNTQLLVEKKADAVTRCESTSSAPNSDTREAKTAACLCSALTLEGTRSRSVVTLPPPSRPAPQDKTKSGLELRASIWAPGIYSDQPWQELMFFADCGDAASCESVASCFVDRNAAVPNTRLGVTVSFDNEGVATHAAIADFEQLLAPEENACVVKKLMTLRIPCPDSANSSRKGKLDLRVGAL